MQISGAINDLLVVIPPTISFRSPKFRHFFSVGFPKVCYLIFFSCGSLYVFVCVLSISCSAFGFSENMGKWKKRNFFLDLFKFLYFGVEETMTDGLLKWGLWFVWLLRNAREMEFFIFLFFAWRRGKWNLCVCDWFTLWAFVLRIFFYYYYFFFFLFTMVWECVCCLTVI